LLDLAHADSPLNQFISIALKEVALDLKLKIYFVN